MDAPGPEILEARLPHELEAARELFREYQNAVQAPECFTTFEAERAALPGEYAPPRGVLLLAREGRGARGAWAGCVALRPLGPDVCEMKRLYVRAGFQGRGLGRLLVERLLRRARELGYARLRLDTLPAMDAAVRLYERLGFTPIPRYNDNPVAAARFFERPLR